VVLVRAQEAAVVGAQEVVVVAAQAAAGVAAAPCGAVVVVAEAPGDVCAADVALGSCGKGGPAAALVAAWAEM